MDESFSHQLHGSAYSYFFTGEHGVLQDGMGRTLGKGQRLIMVHAITKQDPLAACDDAGLPVQKGWFKPEESGKGRQERGPMGEEDIAEMLWQAKITSGDCHHGMTDKMFMEWLEKRLASAFKDALGNNEMILVLDNGSYHHGYDPEVGVPETNTKKHNTELLRKYKAGRITVQREERDGKGGKKVVVHNSPSRTPGVAVVLAVRRYSIGHSSLLSAQISPTNLRRKLSVHGEARVAADLDPPLKCHLFSRSSCFGKIVSNMPASTTVRSMGAVP